MQVFVEDYNDHCPFLAEVNIDLDLEPIPPLQKDPFFTAVASDRDSGVNAQIRFKASDPERMYVRYPKHISVDVNPFGSYITTCNLSNGCIEQGVISFLGS